MRDKMELGYICVKCGKVNTIKNIRGSMKHPYCKPCFDEEFDSDEAYCKEMKRLGHGGF